MVNIDGRKCGGTLILFCLYSVHAACHLNISPSHTQHYVYKNRNGVLKMHEPIEDIAFIIDICLLSNRIWLV